MKEAVAKDLSANLRSGKYKQGGCALRCFNGITGDEVFCILGVLGDMCSPDKWVQMGGVFVMAGTNSEGKPFEGLSYLPHNVLEWAGIDGNAQEKLSRMNDSERNTFAELADYIDSNWRTI